MRGVYKTAPIKDYPNYLITENGKVYSNNYGRITRLRTHINRGGYERIGLCRDGKTKMFLIHDLVAKAFLPNPNNKPFINHKDENKLNNNVNNLEWCNSKENNSYGTRLARIAESNKKRVIQLDKDGNVLKEWDSQTDAGRSLGLKNINACLKGRRKLCGGFMWRYAND